MLLGLHAGTFETWAIGFVSSGIPLVANNEGDA